MRPFKEGAFVLAKRMHAGIIPIVHTGTERTFDKGSWALKGRALIRIRVLDEIPASVVDAMEPEELSALVRERMEAGLPPWKGRVRSIPNLHPMNLRPQGHPPHGIPLRTRRGS
ncbi:MAG: hypothetical protein R2751_14015 [Bacteroidales bacterium]